MDEKGIQAAKEKWERELDEYDARAKERRARAAKRKEARAERAKGRYELEEELASLQDQMDLWSADSEWTDGAAVMGKMDAIRASLSALDAQS